MKISETIPENFVILFILFAVFLFIFAYISSQPNNELALNITCRNCTADIHDYLVYDARTDKIFNICTKNPGKCEIKTVKIARGDIE